MTEKKIRRNLQLKTDVDSELSKKVDAAATLLDMNVAQFLEFSIDLAFDHIVTNADQFVSKKLETVRNIEHEAREAIEFIASHSD